MGDEDKELFHLAKEANCEWSVVTCEWSFDYANSCEAQALRQPDGRPAEPQAAFASQF